MKCQKQHKWRRLQGGDGNFSRFSWCLTCGTLKEEKLLTKGFNYHYPENWEEENDDDFIPLGD